MAVFPVGNELQPHLDHSEFKLWPCLLTKAINLPGLVLVNTAKERPQKAWVKVFRIIPEFRILRLTFHRKSASKC